MIGYVNQSPNPVLLTEKLNVDWRSLGSKCHLLTVDKIGEYLTPLRLRALTIFILRLVKSVPSTVHFLMFTILQIIDTFEITHHIQGSYRFVPSRDISPFFARSHNMHNFETGFNLHVLVTGEPWEMSVC